MQIIALVRFKDGGRKCFGSWHKIKSSRKYYRDLEGNGSCLTSSVMTSRGLSVLCTCTARMREQMKSTSCATGCSA